MKANLKRIRHSIQNKRPFKAMINYLILYPAAYVRILKRKTTGNQRGFYISNIELTNKCLMKCIMCARTHQMTRAQGIMDFELFRRKIDEYVRLNPKAARSKPLWLHHFGESLLHPQFDRFIRYCSDLGIPAYLSLNPIMLTEENSNRLLMAEPHLLYFSLDGHDDDSFCRIRGLENAYSRSVENTLRFLELKKQHRSTVLVHVSMVDFEDNAASIVKMRKFWIQKEGVDEFVKKGFSTGIGDVARVNELSSSDIHHRRQKKNRIKPRRAFCNYPFESLTVLWDGRVVPCCFDYDAKYVLGDLQKNSLQEIWNDSPAQLLRRQFKSNQVDCALCKNCLSLHTPQLIP